MPAPHRPQFRRNPGTPWALLALVVLIAGGILFAGSHGVAVAIAWRDTYYVLPTGAAMVYVALAFAIVGLIYFGFSRLFGRKLSSILSVLHFSATLVAVTASISGSFLAARSGPATPSSAPVNLRTAIVIESVGLLAFGFSIVVFLFNLVWSSFRGEKV